MKMSTEKSFDHRRLLESPKSYLESKVSKGSKSPLKSLDNVSHEEMQKLLAKLKDLVPNMPKNKKLSKLEIIQNVIDYIFDLESELETSITHTQSNQQNLAIATSQLTLQNQFQIYVPGS